jgi:hypothetical protein
MHDPYYESVQPIPQIIELIDKAGELLSRKRRELQRDDIDKLLEYLGKVRTALDGKSQTGPYDLMPCSAGRLEIDGGGQAQRLS